MSQPARELYDVQTEDYDVKEDYRENQMVLRLNKEKFVESAVDSSWYSVYADDTVIGMQDEMDAKTFMSSSGPPTFSANSIFSARFKLPVTEFDARTVIRPIAVVQQWEGIVMSVGDDDFTARLYDITDPTNPVEEADFLVEDLNPYNLPLLKEGAIFRWIIGYRGGKTSTRSRVSQLTFRRLPAWTKRDLADADQKAKELVKGIDWE